MDNFSKRCHKKPVKSDDTGALNNFQTKLIFTGFKSYGNFECLPFETKTVTFEKLKCSSFCGLEFCKFHMYKTYYKLLKSNRED